MHTNDTSKPATDRSAARVKNGQRFSAIASLGTAALGGVVFLGWVLDVETVKRVLPWAVSMKVNTAIGFILCGTALYLKQIPRYLPHSRYSAAVLSLAVIAIGLVTNCQYLLNTNFGIDQLLFADDPTQKYPGRMAPMTALCFTLLGLAILTLDSAKGRPWWPAQILGCLSAITALFAALGYFFSVTNLYAIGTYTPMALHTALGFLSIAAALATARPGYGWVGIFLKDELGSVLIRKLVPYVFLIVIGMGWLQLQGMHSGFQNPVDRIAFFMGINLILIAAMALFAANWINHIETKRRAEEQARLAAHKLLQNSEDMYRLLAESSSDMISRVSPDGTFRYVSPAAFELTGYTPAELTGRSAYELVHPEDLRRLIQENAEIAEKNLTIEESEYRIRQKNGTWVWIETTARKIRNAEGMITEVIGASRDITQRKQAEDLLRESERHYRLLAENSTDTIARFSPEGIIRYLSPSIFAMTGYRPEELVGTNSFEFIHPDDLVRLRAKHVEGLERDEAPPVSEYRIRRKDGSYVWVETTARFIYDDAGKIIEIVASRRDVSSRKKAEDALQESERLYRLLAQHSQDTIARFSTEGVFQYVSPSVTSMTGYTPEELIGHLGYEFVHPDDLANLRSRHLHLLEHSKGRELSEYRIRRKDGSWIRVETASYFVRDAEGKATEMIAVRRDITERIQLQAQLLQSQKMETIGQLAGGIAHDFNNFLTVVLTSLDLIDPSAVTQQSAKEDLALIRQGAEQAAGLTRQLLQFARKQIVSPKSVHLGRLLEDMSKMLRRLIGENVHLHVNSDASLWDVFVDAGQMEQVIVNLAVNARDAMPDGGSLTFAVSNTAIDQDSATQKVPRQAGEYVLLTVTDTGMGMNEQVKEKIFEPFYTTKEIGRGTGLGLATVQGILMQAEGHIEVASRPGRGTTFRIYLPRSRTIAAETEAIPRATIASATETILLVEDEPALLRIAERLLRKQGYTVLPAGSGEEALRIATAHSGPIHLVLTDVIMPHMGGKELLRRIGQIRPGTPAMYMSGYTDDVVVRNNIIEKGAVFIQKPFTIDTLARKVREALGGGGQNSLHTR